MSRKLTGFNIKCSCSYQWALNGVDITGATGQIYNASQEGIYTVTTVLGSCESTSLDFNLTYLIATISSTGGNNFCTGGGIDLTASTGTSYQWQLNGIDIPGATNQIYYATVEGVYNVIVVDGLCSLTSADFILMKLFLSLVPQMEIPHCVQEIVLIYRVLSLTPTNGC